MINFNCPNCSQKLKVPEDRAGKKGKCPKCKNPILIPDSQTVADLLTPVPAPDGSQPQAREPYKLTFLDAPQKTRPETEPTDTLEHDSDSDTFEQDQNMLLLGYRKPEPEPTPERKLPWPIDIFLYPTSASSLIIILITVVLPLLLHLLASFLRIFTMTFPPGAVFLVLVQITRFLAGILLFLYIWWYLCECITDSATGGLRAPETAGKTPGFEEIFFSTLRIVGCIVFFTAPAVFYLGYCRRVDTTLWILYACGAFFFPMGLLAVVMFDSIRGVNPLLVIASIFSTFFQYIGLVLFYYVPALAIPVIIYFLRHSFFVGHIAKFTGVYFGMVTAHLLGRFFFRYQEKLNWEV
ncbi:MAG: hypothetical protein H8E73_07495 [Planctomycetes bacterium]|nr:hypothetical protein [Planctomycetota bacterium]